MNTLGMSAFGSPSPKFELYYAVVDKQSGELIATGTSPTGILADAPEMTGPPKDCFELRPNQSRGLPRSIDIGHADLPVISVTNVDNYRMAFVMALLIVFGDCAYVIADRIHLKQAGRKRWNPMPTRVHTFS